MSAHHDPEALKARQAKLCQAMQSAGVDVFLASSPVTMTYLSGFGEFGYERILQLALHADGRIALICPALTATAARRAGLADVRPWSDTESPEVLMQALADEWGLESAVIGVDRDMAAAHLLAWQALLPAALFRNGQPVVAQLMMQKDPTELATLEQAARIADAAWDSVRSSLRPGMTEREVAGLLSRAMEQRGGKPTFTLVAAGANGAEPHHETDDTVLQTGDVVVIDFGCEWQGYQSDITRTICVGAATPDQQAVYSTVYRAFMAGREAVREGVTGAEVDAAARQVIADAGWGEFFVHRTGHGIGMRGHEEPYIASTNLEPLSAGNCFSIEPGIYLPGQFGVRIENIVTCTAEGHRSLNAEPSPTLLELG